MVFPKDFPKDSKIRVQNIHIFALSLVMNELLKVRDIQARLGIGRSAVYALIHEPSFPAPIAINSRTLRWEITEFEQWLLSQYLMNADLLVQADGIYRFRVRVANFV